MRKNVLLFGFPLTLFGCFAVNIDNIQFTCEGDGESCPAGQVCLDEAVCIDDQDLIPSVDPVVKVTPFGQVLVTGKSLRGAEVRVLIDGEVVAEGEVDPDPDPDEILGDFSLFAPIQEGENRLTVEAELAGVILDIDVDLEGNELLVELDPDFPLFLEEAQDRNLALLIEPLGEAQDNMGATFQDIDGDGDLDLIIGSDPDGVVRLNNNGNFAAGPALNTQVAAAFADFDEDGDLDAAVSSSNGLARSFLNLLREQGALSFVQDVAFGNAENSEGVAFLDLNADLNNAGNAGFVDILLQDGGENRVQFNDGTGVFFQENTNLFLAAKQGGTDENANGSFLAVCDFDSDGFVDAAVNDRPNHQFFLGFGNDQVVRVQGNFFDENANVKRGLSFADIDQDGVFDLVVALGNQGLEVLRLNRQGININAQLIESINVNTDGLMVGDFDLDGDLDILASGDDGEDHLLLNEGGLQGGDAGTLLDASEFLQNAGDGEGVAVGDIDGDGDLDAFVVDQAQDSRLYINNFQGVHFRTLRVARQVGGQLIDVVGATVLLEENADGGPRFFAIRQVDGGSGHGSQEPLTLHFGGVAPRRSYLATITVPGCVPVEVVLEPGDDIFSFNGACP